MKIEIQLMCHRAISGTFFSIFCDTLIMKKVKDYSYHYKLQLLYKQQNNRNHHTGNGEFNPSFEWFAFRIEHPEA